jgi:GNAT superfamily N-acetyltransferase
LGTAHHVEDYSAAALWLLPNTQSDDQALIEMLQRTVREREMQVVFAYFEEMAKYHPAEPHWHLTLIGVDPIRQGQGYGSALLKYGLAACDHFNSCLTWNARSQAISTCTDTMVLSCSEPFKLAKRPLCFR